MFLTASAIVPTLLSLSLTLPSASASPNPTNTTLLPRTVVDTSNLPTPAPPEDWLVDKMICNLLPEPGWADVHAKNVIYAAYDFCTNIAPLYSPYNRPMPLVKTLISTQGEFDGSESGDYTSDIFNIKVEDMGEGCKTGDSDVDMLHPLGWKTEAEREDTGLCQSTLFGLWQNCTQNEGQGGSVEVGCLRFSLWPENGDNEPLFGALWKWLICLGLCEDATVVKPSDPE